MVFEVLLFLASLCAISAQQCCDPLVPQLPPAQWLSQPPCPNLPVYPPLDYDTWSGPKTEVVKENGRLSLQINGETIFPFWFAIQEAYTSNFSYAILQAKNHGVKILEVAFDYIDHNETRMQDLISILNPQVAPYYLIFRLVTPVQFEYCPMGTYYLYTGPKVRFSNYSGGETINDPMGAPSLSPEMIAYQQQVVTNVSRTLDYYFPGRIVGIRTGYENFILPGTFSNNQWQSSVNEKIIDGDVEAAYFADYNDWYVTNFCKWPGIPAEFAPSCSSLPSPIDRNTGNFGQNFLVADPKNPQTILSAYFNQYYAREKALMNTLVSEAILKASQGNATNVVFYGYMNALGYDIAHAGHIALQQLEQCGSVGMIAGPYSYNTPRNLGHAFFGESVMDSVALNNVLYVHEDDSMTYICGLDEGCASPNTNYFMNWYVQVQESATLEDTLAFERRNIITATLHNSATYLLDLYHGLVWANQLHPNETEQFWSGLQGIISSASKVSFSSLVAYFPETAVFVDELSYSFQPILGADGNDNYNRAQQFSYTFIDNLSRSGVVYRQYLLSDLLNENLDLTHIRLAIFQNAFKVPSEIREAIQKRLYGSSLFYIYAPGLIDDNDTPSVDNMFNLTGIRITQGNGSLTGLVAVYAQSLNVSWGIGSGQSQWSPWFYVNDPDATNVWTYTLPAEVNTLSAFSFKKNQFGNTVYYSALPGIAPAALRQVAQGCVHLFSNVTGDSVDSFGNTLVINTLSDGPREITLPFDPVNVVMDQGNIPPVGICTSCTSFSISLAAKETYIFRWEE